MNMKKGQRLLPTKFLKSHDLEYIPKLSYGQHKAGNYIFHGDNLIILKAILPKYSDLIRCIYIDPPYNNQERYTHYIDGRSHELWLKELIARIEYLVEFLSPDGSIWISIDDREVHYLKVAIDQILGRENFITTVIWQQRTTRENRKVFSNNHEYLLVYAKNAKQFKATRNLLPLTTNIESRYKNPDNDPRGPWQSISLNVQAGHGTKSQFYEIAAPNGYRYMPPKGRCWIYNQPRMYKEIESNNVWFGQNGHGVPRLKRFMSKSRLGLTPETLWMGSDVGTNDTAKKHILELFPNQPVFDTPKPEQLIYRILQIATNPRDTVLDAYLGAGTTTAVAHKMGRLYIGIENGSHAITHCAYRMRQVVDGENGGISKLVNWDGGGGFDFYRLKHSD